MKCPVCKTYVEVLETRPRSDGVTRRRYMCANTHRFTTLEVIVEAKIKEKIAADPKAFYGFPSGSVSSSNAGGKCVTAGETAPIDPNQWAFDRGLEST